MIADLPQLQEALGVKFSDARLLLEAVTHRSYTNEFPDSPVPDNERLEFLGDAVLDYLTAEYLFMRLPDADEGVLTAVRAALVRAETLAALAEQLGLGEHLRLGKGEEASGGRGRALILCAAFEAVVGAISIGVGLDEARDFLFPLIQPLVADLQGHEALKDAKSRLQEVAQGRLHVTPTYRTKSAVGPDHAKRFTVEVRLGDVICGVGQGHSKQLAQQAAALEALRSRFGEPESYSADPDDRLKRSPRSDLSDIDANGGGERREACI